MRTTVGKLKRLIREITDDPYGDTIGGIKAGDHPEEFQQWLWDVRAVGLGVIDEYDAMQAYKLGWSLEEYADRELADERDRNR